MKKFFINFFRFILWAYAILGYIFVMSLVPLILLELLLNPILDIGIIDNVLGFSEAILSNGVIGLLAIVLYAGQFFIAYYLYKRLSRFV